MEKKVIHRAASRGHANFGWLDAYYTFSFGRYYDPERVDFGMLRVLNDNILTPGAGFGTHPHDNMDILTIPLEGNLEYRDSKGNVFIVNRGDVHLMSAGSGITHSEHNRSSSRLAKYLQIWIYPEVYNTEPRYGQVTYDADSLKDSLMQMASPNRDDEGLWLNQQAWIFIGGLAKGKSVEYKVRKKGHGVYVFIVRGEVNVNGNGMRTRDGIGLWDVETIELKADTMAELLVIEVPMQ